MAAKPTKGNSTNTDGGTEISFQNTPQAKDDDFGSGANRLDVASTIYTLDVMGNDLGGNGKSLWSVDDGVNLSGAMSGQEPGDLLTQDLAGATGLPANRSLFGASLSVTAEGKVAYDTSTIDAAIAINLKKLALGETMADSFIYAIRLGSGTLSWAKATVTLTGVNDTPEVAAVTAVTTEDASVTGAFLGDDIDNDDNINSLIYNIVGTPAAGEIVNNNDGTFTFDPKGDFQSLAVDDVATILLSYTATDSHGATSAAGSLQITINGVNDAPTLNGAALAVTEDGAAANLDLAALADDVDSDDTGASLSYSLAAPVPEGTVTFSGASLTFDPGSDFQYLGAGVTKDVVFSVVAKDSHGATATASFTTTVTGVNDAAVLGSATANLVETDEQLTTGGVLGISDADTGEGVFNVQNNVAGSCGSFSIDAAGNWSYTTNGPLNELEDTQVVSDVFNVTSADGTATSVTVNITGTSDGPTAVDDSNSLTASTVEINTSNHVYWVDWTSITQIPGNNHEAQISGIITLPDRTIDVTYTGQYYASQTFINAGNTTNYWRSFNGSQWLQGGDGVYTSAEVANGPGDTNFDFIALAYVNTPRNLSFSEPVANLFFAVASMNNNGYLFDQPFTVVSSADSASDRGNWGYTAGITLSENNGQYGISTAGFSPNEFHGVLEINNAVDSLTWVGQTEEFWQGFTIGTYGIAQSATASGNVLANDDKGGATSTISVSDVGGQAMVGNSVTLNLASGAILKVDKDGDYLYNDNGAFAHLPGGATATDSVVYTVVDNKGYSDTATLSITITGVNDEAVLGSATFNLVETDAVLTGSGALSISDLDDGEAHFNAQSNVAGTYGSFSIDAAGNWSYATNTALDELNVGDNVSDVFAVTSADGTETSVTINIAGTADGPTANNDSNSLSASTVVPNTSNTVYWVDWRSVTITGPRVGNATSGDAPVHVEGVITLGDGHEITVTYEGLAFIVQANEQKYVYTGSNLNEYEWTQPGLPNDPAYISSQVNAAPATKDIIGLNEAFIGGGFQNASGTRTDFSLRNLTFSEPVENLFFAVVSMNNNGYKFDQSFEIVSQGPGKYGDSSTISPTNFGNGQWGIVSGGEFNAVLKIDGSVDHLTWASQNKETWNGFTVGTYGQSQTATVTGNVLSNDVADAGAPNLSVSNVGGQVMAVNSITLELTNGATLKVDKNGSYFFDDNGGFASLGANQSHVENITYTVIDNQGQTNTAVLSITVNGVNDAAVLGSANVTVQEEEGLIRTQGTLSISDVDTGEALFNVQNSTHGAYGTFTLRDNGSWIYLSDTNLDFLKQGEVVSDTFTAASVDGTTTTVTVNIVGTSQTFVAPGNLVTNGSFESGLAPWEDFYDGVDLVSDSLWDAAEGTYSIDLNAFDQGGIRQTISTQDGTTYGVFFQLSKNYDGSGTVPSASITLEEEGGTDQSYIFAESNSPTNMLWRGETFVFIADTGTSSTTLSFVSDMGGAKGAAIDDVVVLANTLISGFDKADGDVLDLHNLLLSITAPTDGTAFSGGYLNFLQNGSDTLIRVDPNGGGDDYLTAVTLVGVNLASTDTDNYVL